MPRRRFVLPALVACTAVICAITLTPIPRDYTPESTLVTAVLSTFAAFPLTAWIDFTVLEFSANIVMFVPFGLLVALLAGPRRWWLGIIAGAAFTLFIEGFQGAFLPTRFATVSDLIANTSGAIIGAVVALLLMRIAARRERTTAATSANIRA